MNEALVAAQQLREETRATAEREAQIIVREAEADGLQRRAAAEREEEHARERLADVQRQFAGYLAGFRALLERQLAELRTLEGDRG
jgi:cell division initiation protein